MISQKCSWLLEAMGGSLNCFCNLSQQKCFPNYGFWSGPSLSQKAPTGELPSFDLRGSFAYIFAKYPVFVYTCFRLVEQLFNTEAKVRGVLHVTHSHPWRSKPSEGMTKQSETCSLPLPLLLLVLLFVFLYLAHTYQLLLSRSRVHLSVLLEQCWVSAMRQLPTNGLLWERLGSVVGTLLPSLLSLPGNLRCLREGPPTCPSTEWTPNKNSHQQVSYTSQCWFFFSLFFSPPLSFFFHS